MTITYLGTLTLGEITPGLTKPLRSVLTALGTLRAAVGGVKASVELQAQALGTLKASLELQLLAGIEAQIDANLDAAANINLAITDPSAYLTGMLAGAAALTASLDVGLPEISASLGADLAANASIAAELTAEKAALQLLVDAAAEAKIALDALVGTITAAIQAALDVEATATAGLETALNSGGLYLYRYDGAVGSLGTELQAQVGAGLPGGAGAGQVVMALVIAAGSPGANAALTFAFKVN